MAAVEVRLLGRLVIDVDGKRADDARLGDLGRKAFAYLLLERRRPVPRNELADVLWGEDLPARPGPQPSGACCRGCARSSPTPDWPVPTSS